MGINKHQWWVLGKIFLLTERASWEVFRIRISSELSIGINFLARELDSILPFIYRAIWRRAWQSTPVSLPGLDPHFLFPLNNKVMSKNSWLLLRHIISSPRRILHKLFYLHTNLWLGEKAIPILQKRELNFRKVKQFIYFMVDRGSIQALVCLLSGPDHLIFML